MRQSDLYCEVKSGIEDINDLLDDIKGYEKTLWRLTKNELTDNEFILKIMNRANLISDFSKVLANICELALTEKEI